MKLSLMLAAFLMLAHIARAEQATVMIQETVILTIPGATAVYTTNPLIADARIISAGRLSVTGHSAGSTQLVVVTASGTQSFLITVGAAAGAAVTRPATGEVQTRYEGRYSSGSARIQNTVDVVKDGATGSSEFHVLHIRDLLAGTGEDADSIPSIFYRRTTPGRIFTLLDETVDVSRMTILNTQLRGLHLRDGPLELHGGYASSAMYDSLFLPAERRWAAGAGYAIDTGSMRLTPSVYGFFSEPAGTAARRGVVAALGAEYRNGETLFTRADVGISDSLPAAAGEVRYVSLRDQFAAAFSFKPDDFPTLGLTDIGGARAELDWTRLATNRLAVASHGTYDRFKLAGLTQTIGAGSLNLRYALTSRMGALAGADVSAVRTPARSIRTVGLPVSLTYDAPGIGLTASYRVIDSSAASRRGDALRLGARAGHGRFSANAWAERQRQAPTLDLIFSAEPGLELALLRLGISVRNPEDVARALRDNAALIDLGFITGVTVDLTPMRYQAGFNLGWMGSGARSDHLRLLAVYGRDEGIRTTRENLIATLTYSRRVLAATDLYGSYTWYQTMAGAQKDTGNSVDVGLRQQFSGLPAFLRQAGTIEGYVFLDPNMEGDSGQTTRPLAGISITLDEARTVQSDARGRYEFPKVAPGSHRVTAQLPPSPPAFFTTPSHADVRVPARVDFGLVWTASRIDGRVISDAGSGIANAVVSASSNNSTALHATSDAGGRFMFAVPSGMFRIAIAAASLPPGYSVAGELERNVRVDPDHPQSVSFEVQALRSVAGRAPGADEVRIELLDRVAHPDGNGNFVFRSMPSGTFTLTANVRGRSVSQTVTMPSEPSMIRDVILGAPAVATESPLPADAGRAASSSGFRLAAGAFRVHGNAEAMARRIESAGWQADIGRSGSLTVVTVGPFATRVSAEAEAEALKKRGVDVVMIADRLRSAPRAATSLGSHVVQAGAFRDQRNAGELLGRLKRTGEQPFTVATSRLTVVYIGPFATRRDAVASSERLREAGFDVYVTRR